VLPIRGDVKDNASRIPTFREFLHDVRSRH
jgi:hypothetical protein